MKNITEKLVSLIPYEKPFLFVDELTKINEFTIKGNYTFLNNYLFLGHFKSEIVIPGVLLIEVASQIGLVCHYLYLNPGCIGLSPFLASIETEFLNPAKLGSKLKIVGEKIYFRHNILKSKVIMYSCTGDVILRMTAICKFK